VRAVGREHCILRTKRTLLLFGYTSLFLEELNNMQTRRELGKKEPGVEDRRETCARGGRVSCGSDW
jgi:hypothetical protein